MLMIWTPDYDYASVEKRMTAFASFGVREPDTVLAEQLRALGPFETIVVDGSKSTVKSKCELCQQNVSTWVDLIPEGKIADDLAEPIAVCFNHAGLLIDPEVVDAKMKDLVDGTRGGLGGVPDPRDVMTGARARMKAAKEPPSVIDGAVLQAKVHLADGRGKHWRIIPNLIEQWESSHYFTQKQYDCILKFNRSCVSELL